jgi:hypothetical protein
MSTRKRTARRFQVEAMETRVTPGGASGGGVLAGMTCHIGEEIPQIQVAHVETLKGPSGGTQVAHVETLKGPSGGTLLAGMTCHIGEEIPQIQVAHVETLRGPSGGTL